MRLNENINRMAIFELTPCAKQKKARIELKNSLKSVTPNEIND